ncbi:hypothetical protein CVM73_29700 [Bradyrhizobium forestalis]|uniref:Uncharacterized protein n=1 Tax=Bradyrhizobium forestalis TaxID=1419263 RepID=A0A2M8R1I0_9BRAD|nr:hypothetical protein CVM73_29700 [Bradyrhizobium forestalis]
MMWIQASDDRGAPLPLAGEVGAERRLRALSSGGVSLWRHPLPNPPPQAGEGADLHRRTRRARHD